MVDRHTVRFRGAIDQSMQWNSFSGCSRYASITILLCLLALIGYGVSLTWNAPHPTKLAGEPNTVIKGYSDHDLYRDIIHRVQRGESYYQSAAAEQRKHEYPTRPFIAVRPPTLVWIASFLSINGLKLATIGIGVIAIVAWYFRLSRDPDLPRWAAWGCLAMLLNLTHTLTPEWAVIHEVPAGILIAIAIALYKRDSQWPTFVIMALAVCIRETALPVAAMCGFLSLIDRNWRMAAAWIAFALVFSIGLAVHAHHVAEVALPTDRNSPGWSGLGGWHTYLAAVGQTSILRFSPAWTPAVFIPLAFLGWLSWRSRTAFIMVVVQAGYAALLMLAARKDNFYWAMILVPTLFMGLVFVPKALAQLLQSAFGNARRVGGRRFAR